jgi:hypothetical protein
MSAFLPVVDDLDLYQVKREFPEPLPKPPFIMILLGSRGSSKSTILSNLILRSEFYGDVKGKPPVFEDIILISPTLGHDSTGRFLAKKATQTYRRYEDDVIEGLMSFQENLDKKDRRNMLIVLDDITADSNYKPDSLVNKLCSIHRHLMISIIFLIHKVSAVPPVVRNCYTNLFILRMPNAKEQDKLFEELSYLTDKKSLKKMYDYCCYKPYHTMVVDAIKNTVHKWGASDAEFVWKKYNDNGGYSDVYQLPDGFENKLEKLENDKKRDRKAKREDKELDNPK